MEEKIEFRFPKFIFEETRLAEVFSSHRVLCLLRSACRQEILMHPNVIGFLVKPRPQSGDPYSSDLFLKVAVVSSLQFWACQVPQTPGY